MEFSEDQAIYKQIADRICDGILAGSWSGDERIPSIRELAVDIEVNPNTVMRSYTYLQNLGIIYNQRGVGYFVATGAYARIVGLKRDEFLSKDLPQFFRKLELLGIGFDEIERLYVRRKGGLENREDKQ